MKTAERYFFLEEGLPLILASAEGFWNGVQALTEHHREADVLEGFAHEEAAKVLILVDMMRCPKKEQAQRAGSFVTWFYSHLARLIYADTVSWRPYSKAEQRAYVDRERRSHEVDGPVGEYILPAGPIYDRERRLYADIQAFEKGEPLWNAPHSWRDGLLLARRVPPALRLAQAMQRLGLFTAKGLAATADVWGGQELTDALTYHERLAVTETLLKRLDQEGLFHEDASDKDVSQLYHQWPFPMWDFGLDPIIVPLEELEAERDANLWWETGEP